MDKSLILGILALFTLLSGMAVAAYQLWDAEKAKKMGEHGNSSLKPD